MTQEFNLISKPHQKKLKHIAKSKGIDVDTALRNIIQYIEQQNANIKAYFKDFVTARQIEQMIDLLRT